MNGRLRSRRRAFLAGAILLALGAVQAHAGAQSFTARADRSVVTAGQAFLFEVSLILDDGRAEGYQPPAFAGVTVISAQPSQSTQISMGGGTTFMQVVYTWRYELVPTQAGPLGIGPARVRVAGKALETKTVSLTVVGSGVPPPASKPAIPADPDPTSPTEGPEPASGESFLRVVLSKDKVVVGEPIIATWYLYLSERQDKYQPVTEPRAEGFWTEDLPIPGNGRGLSLSQQVYRGRVYLVAPLLKKALFPLRAGTLTITPLESEIAQVDFFGATMRTQRLRAQPVSVEVQALPEAGRPGAGPVAVGKLALTATVDRTAVAVGDAVTLTVVVAGQANIRQLTPPPLPPLAGVKAYEPKTTVSVETAGEGVSGSKTVEHLLLAERPGTIEIPALSLAVFDPTERRYTVARSAPLVVSVSGDVPKAAAAAGGASSGATENVLPTELRPLRARPTLQRDLGTTLYRSPWFGAFLLVPPVGFLLTVLATSLRAHLARETVAGRRRRTRRLVRKRLELADRHRAAGAVTPFFLEIERVLLHVLAEKLGTAVAGLSRDELRSRLAKAGFGEDVVARVVRELEVCDEARFAPGGVDGEGLSQSLERAGELIDALEKQRFTPGRNVA